MKGNHILSTSGGLYVLDPKQNSDSFFYGLPAVKELTMAQSFENHLV